MSQGLAWLTRKVHNYAQQQEVWKGVLGVLHWLTLLLETQASRNPSAGGANSLGKQAFAISREPGLAASPPSVTLLTLTSSKRRNTEDV